MAKCVNQYSPFQCRPFFERSFSFSLFFPTLTSPTQLHTNPPFWSYLPTKNQALRLFTYVLDPSPFFLPIIFPPPPRAPICLPPNQHEHAVLHVYVIYIFTYLFIILVTYTMLTLIDENYANASIALSWLTLH